MTHGERDATVQDKDKRGMSSHSMLQTNNRLSLSFDDSLGEEAKGHESSNNDPTGALDVNITDNISSSTSSTGGTNTNNNTNVFHQFQPAGANLTTALFAALHQSQSSHQSQQQPQSSNASNGMYGRIVTQDQLMALAAQQQPQQQQQQQQSTSGRTHPLIAVLTAAAAGSNNPPISSSSGSLGGSTSNSSTTSSTTTSLTRSVSLLVGPSSSLSSNSSSSSSSGGTSQPSDVINKSKRPSERGSLVAGSEAPANGPTGNFVFSTNPIRSVTTTKTTTTTIMTGNAATINSTGHMPQAVQHRLSHPLNQPDTSVSYFAGTPQQQQQYHIPRFGFGSASMLCTSASASSLSSMHQQQQQTKSSGVTMTGLTNFPRYLSASNNALNLASSGGGVGASTSTVEPIIVPTVGGNTSQQQSSVVASTSNGVKYRDSAQAPMRKLSVDLIKTYKHINEVGDRFFVSFSLLSIIGTSSLLFRLECPL